MSCRNPRQAKEEIGIFRALLKAWPSFAKDVIEITQPCQPYPDITVKLCSDLEIEFELGEWLNQQQMQVAKKTERLEASLLTSIGAQGSCQSNNFQCVMLGLQDNSGRFNPRDAGQFRSQLFTLIDDTDRRWPHERGWNSPQGHVCSELKSYPALAKFLQSILFVPKRVGNRPVERWSTRHPWIFFRSWGGWYSSDSAVDALRGIIQKKQNHYGDARGRDVRLLIYYDQAIVYNTPFLGVEVRSFKDVATVAADELSGKQLVFHNVYLFQALEPDLQAYEIYPEFLLCQ